MNYRTVKLTLIFLAILIMAACSPMPQAMRRESKPVRSEIALSLDQALNLSLAYGDYRKVNVNWAEVAG